MIVFSKYLIPRGYTGLAVYPFVFLKNRKLKDDKALVNHEKIHLRQQLEMLVIPFFLVYSLEFFFRLIQYRNWYVAYRNISFEREAYKKQNDLNYLKSRSFWKFVEYF